jgi:hypothetical protein
MEFSGAFFSLRDKPGMNDRIHRQRPSGFCIATGRGLDACAAVSDWMGDCIMIADCTDGSIVCSRTLK